MYKISEEMKKLADEVINENPKKFLPIKAEDVTIRYLVSNKGKTTNGKTIYGDCHKQAEKQALLSGCDFVITFYADGVALPPEKQKILMEHELMHVGVNDEGNPYIVPHDIEDFAEILEKYGVRWQDA